MPATLMRSFFLPVLFVVFSYFAYRVYQAGFVANLFTLISPLTFVPEFIAGMLYTSALTAPFAVAAFFVIGKYTDPLTLAAVGGLGSMISDLIILKFFRFLFFGKSSPFSGVKEMHWVIKKLRSFSLFRTFAPIIGGIIIASPLPDELGLMILGITKINTWQASLLLYALDFAGIYVIASIAHSLP
jgi:hypothetical protein